MFSPGLHQQHPMQHPSPLDPRLNMGDAAPPSMSYKDKYIQGLEERMLLYDEIGQLDAALAEKTEILHDAVMRATSLELTLAQKRQELTSQADKTHANDDKRDKRKNIGIPERSVVVDPTPSSTPDSASRAASANLHSTRSDPVKQTPKAPLPLYPPGVSAGSIPKASVSSSSSKDRFRPSPMDTDRRSSSQIAHDQPPSLKKLKKKSDIIKKAKATENADLNIGLAQPKLSKPVGVAIPKLKKKAAVAPLMTPRKTSASASKGKADEPTASTSKQSKKPKSTSKNAWEFPEYIKSMVLPEVEERKELVLNFVRDSYKYFFVIGALPQVVINPANFSTMTEDLKKSMVAWTDIIRSTHPGSLSHLRHLERVRIELAVHDFLSQKLFWKDIQYCAAAQATGNRTDKLYIAIPEEWADRFADWFSDRIDKGLLDKLPKPKPRRHSAPLHFIVRLTIVLYVTYSLISA